MRWEIAVGCMAGCWMLALGCTWWSWWFAGSYLGMLVSAFGWLLVLVLCVTAAAIARRRRLVVLAVAGTLLLAVPTYNWAAAAPQAWFEVHRPLYDRAVESTEIDDDSYYGSPLPFALRPLAAGAKVSTSGGGGVFFPQWVGIPDDAGGYFYSPDRSPEGADMYGMLCSDPVDLGDGWWMCGMW